MKNMILKTIFTIDFIVFILSAICLDSLSWAPFAVCCVSGGLLFLFLYVNGFLKRR